VLRHLQTLFQADQHPALIVGLDDGDDAAVYRITDEVAVIQTLDFFTPVVDDAYDFGAVAATNAMSDVYAMGGQVALALNICGFPDDLPEAITFDILRGGADKVAEAGAVLVGGHTVRDKEPKYGLAVMGIIHPRRVLTKAGARPGDALILTKPLGVGVITTALKGEAAEADHVAGAVTSMKRLNRTAAQLIQSVGVHACTDVTGFSLLGHGLEMAGRSGVCVRLHVGALPFLDGAVRYAEEGRFPGGTCSNQRAYEHLVRFAPAVPDTMRQLLFTPETSGGLLVAVPPEKLSDLIVRFQEAGEPCWIVGDVTAGEGIEVLAGVPG
jgi:selenide,water dikinase